MVIVYIVMLLITFLIYGVTMWYLYRLDMEYFDQEQVQFGDDIKVDWTTTKTTPIGDLHCNDNNSEYCGTWIVDRINEDILIRDAFIVELKKDLNLLEAYRPELTIHRMLVFVAAYILMNKIDHSVSEKKVHILRQFDFVRTTRDCDQAKAVLDDMASEPTRLVTLLVERRLTLYHTLDYKGYEYLMVNISLELVRMATEAQ